MIKRIYLYTIILCSVGFYNFSFLGKASKLIELAGLCLITMILIVHTVYDKTPPFQRHFATYINIIFLALIPSMIMANVLYRQGFLITIWTQRGVYFYIFYFTLHRMKINPKEIEKAFFIFTFIYIFLYIIQYIIYPIKIINVKIIYDRNTLRIYMDGITYVVLTYFICLQNYFRTLRNKYLLLCIIILIIFVLLGGRQLLAAIIAITMMYLVISKHIKSRLLVFLLIGIAVVAIIYFFHDIFSGIAKATMRTKQEGLQNIRIRALIYYFTNYFKSDWAYIFGNGIPNLKSPYGESMAYIREDYNLVDLGMIGLYFCYGLLFVIGSIGIIIRAFVIRVEETRRYLKFFLIQITLSILTGAGFAAGEFIVPYCMMLYIIDASNYFLNIDNGKK